MRFKVLINWSGEVLTFLTCTDSERKALKNAIRQCAKKVGMSERFVRNYVMEDNKRRWEVNNA